MLTPSDLAAYVAKWRAPTSIGYRGLTVKGMGPPSSGGSTIGESLNILEGFPLSSQTRTQALHEYLETTALAYADRGKYLGDPDFVSIPLAGLLSDSFAAERRANIGPTAATKPVPPGNAEDNEGPNTTHLTVADKWGNVVSYTFTIEQIGGSAMVADGYGFLLNNEMTDFDFVPGGPNPAAARKRPRSSMAPTIVLNDGKPDVTLGSPGGSTIITTVLQTLVEHLDLGMSLPDAIADAARLAAQHGVGERGAGVHRLGRRDRAHGPRSHVHERRRDRRARGHRLPERRAHAGRRGARSARRRARGRDRLQGPRAPLRLARRPVRDAPRRQAQRLDLARNRRNPGPGPDHRARRGRAARLPHDGARQGSAAAPPAPPRDDRGLGTRWLREARPRPLASRA